MAPFSFEQFSDQLHEAFILIDGDHRVQLNLAEATQGHSNEMHEQFSLFFEADAARVVAQGMYKLEHPDFDHLELFLVPIGISEDGSKIRYEAVFNRLKAK
ncbi:DUF6916 family protein [Marinicrinis sediminis]|uniref:DUF6916 family protein n=1 Tax=Marinicrinis sediminis TaxID=1652465 RepID=A0ABW5RFN0_9BACL